MLVLINPKWKTLFVSAAVPCLLAAVVLCDTQWDGSV